MKNILALGAGIIEGAGFGYNTTTAFLARGVREMQIFSRHFGADKHTFYGLAGIGDLMLTSTAHFRIFFSHQVSAASRATGSAVSVWRRVKPWHR